MYLDSYAFQLRVLHSSFTVQYGIVSWLYSIKNTQTGHPALFFSGVRENAQVFTLRRYKLVFCVQGTTQHFKISVVLCPKQQTCDRYSMV